MDDQASNLEHGAAFTVDSWGYNVQEHIEQFLIS